jgi:hypothetical protein
LCFLSSYAAFCFFPLTSIVCLSITLLLFPSMNSDTYIFSLFLRTFYFHSCPSLHHPFFITSGVPGNFFRDRKSVV